MNSPNDGRQWGITVAVLGVFVVLGLIVVIESLNLGHTWTSPTLKKPVLSTLQGVPDHLLPQAAELNGALDRPDVPLSGPYPNNHGRVGGSAKSFSLEDKAASSDHNGSRPVPPRFPLLEYREPGAARTIE